MNAVVNDYAALRKRMEEIVIVKQNKQEPVEPSLLNLVNYKIDDELGNERPLE